MSRVWRGLALLLLIMVMLGLLIEPFLPLPPVWQQLSIGIVLVVHGSFSMLIVWFVQRRIERFRAWRRSQTRSILGAPANVSESIRSPNVSLD